ncbi:MAG TPA: T9SS type A sorting domain-containing protein, partial [Chitinispirillaceae bacterium]|nr:T9SS type A sorting domain-containing protein [Chitinispirillaceae bacterium]
KLIQMLLTPDRTYANLFDAHPPFQIDGNFGAVSGVNEMLVQSQNGEINLLPAIPDVWANGSFRGIRARGNFVLDTVVWSSKTLSKAVISSLSGGTCNLRTKNTTKTIETDSGMTYVLDGTLTVVNQYKSGQTTPTQFTDPQHGNRFAPGMRSSRSVKVFSNAGMIRAESTEEMPDLSFSVFDLSGKLIYSITGKADRHAGFVTPRLNSGIYLVNVTSDRLKHSEKVVVR